MYNIKSGMYKRHPTKEDKAFKYKYSNMTQRCNNPKCISYYNYGGRGIKCLWQNMESFKNDMYESFLEHINIYGFKNTTLDRIDNNGHYCKENCKRSTRKEQAMNRRTNVVMNIDGKEYTYEDISKKIGGSKLRAFYRCRAYLDGKMSIDDLFNKDTIIGKRQNQFVITYNGKKYTCTDIANELGCSKQSIYYRIKKYNKGEIDVNGLFSKPKAQYKLLKDHIG